MAKKETSPEMSTLAARVLGGYKPTAAEVRSLAASVLSQDETSGQGSIHEIEEGVDLASQQRRFEQAAYTMLRGRG